MLPQYLLRLNKKCDIIIIFLFIVHFQSNNIYTTFSLFLNEHILSITRQVQKEKGKTENSLSDILKEKSSTTNVKKIIKKYTII